MHRVFARSLGAARRASEPAPNSTLSQPKVPRRAVHRPIDHYLAVFDRVLGKPTAEDYQRRADDTVARLTAK